MTYHSAKGLTFDTVIMPQLKRNSFSYLSRNEVEKLLFVGISRATKWVCFCAEEGNENPVLQKIIPLEAQQHLTIQYASDDGSLDSGKATEQDDDILDIL